MSTDKETRASSLALKVDKANKKIESFNDFHLYDNGSRVYTPDNKPSAGDISAAPETTYPFNSKDYVVSKSKKVELLSAFEKRLSSKSSHHVRMVTMNTGTPTGAVYVITVSTSGVPEIKRISTVGIGSNNPKLIVEGNLVKITTDHDNDYTVRVSIQSVESNSPCNAFIDQFDFIDYVTASAMSKSEFDANRNERKRVYAGSGFVEWGKSSADSNQQNVNEGLYTFTETPNLIGLGKTEKTSTGISRTLEPITVVDGVEIKIIGNTFEGSYHFNTLKFPDAPDGTKTYDSATGEVVDYTKDIDPKYGDVAHDHNEAVARAFEGLVVNGDFRDELTGWEAINSGSVIVENNIAHVSNNNQPWGGISNTAKVLVKANTTYRFKMFVDNVVGTVNVFLRFIAGVDVSASLTAEHNGKFFEVDITPTSDQDYLDITIEGTNSTDTASLDISQISLIPITNQVITSRQDLAFIEVWHEDISEKDVVYPYGNVQFDTGSYEGISLSNSLVEQGYSAFGEWDTTTKGYGVKWSTLSEVNKTKFINDPTNNIYYDPETKKLIQVRYRIRVVEGKGDEWVQPTPIGVGAIDYNGPTSRVNAQGSSVINLDFSNNYFYQSGHSTYGSNDTYLAKSSKGICFIPICLVQRLNQGGYHPVWNSEGCSVLVSESENVAKWFASNVNGLFNSTKDCFIKWKSGTGKSGVAGGFIGYEYQNLGERPDQYTYYDAIYAGQVQDLRLSANKQETGKLLEDAIRKAVGGEMRGKGKVPFTHCPIKGKITNVVNVKFTTDVLVESFGEGYSAYVYNLTKNQSRFSFIYKNGDCYVKLENIKAYEFNTYNDWAMQYANTVGWSLNDEIWVLPITWLTSEFDSLPWVDIIGSPEIIAATFPNGVVGQWIPQIPDGNIKDWNLNRKAIGNSGRIQTNNSGSNWVTYTLPFDSTKNLYRTNMLTGGVGLWYYETPSYFTEKANNSVVIGEVGDVFYSSNHVIDYGNRFSESVCGVIGKNSDGNRGGNSKLSYDSVYENKLFTSNYYSPKHFPILTGTPSNDSGGVKSLYTLTSKDSLLYIQFHGNELKYDNNSFLPWGDDCTIPIIDGDGTKTDLNNQTVKTFCHHSIFPIGINSFTDSSQSSK